MLELARCVLLQADAHMLTRALRGAAASKQRPTAGDLGWRSRGGMISSQDASATRANAYSKLADAPELANPRQSALTARNPDICLTRGDQSSPQVLKGTALNLPRGDARGGQ